MKKIVTINYYDYIIEADVTDNEDGFSFSVRAIEHTWYLSSTLLRHFEKLSCMFESSDDLADVLTTAYAIELYGSRERYNRAWNKHIEYLSRLDIRRIRVE